MKKLQPVCVRGGVFLRNNEAASVAYEGERNKEVVREKMFCLQLIIF